MMGLIKSDKMGDYEKENNKASYKTIVNYFIGDIVLCNNIIELDDSIHENLNIEPKYYNENGEEITEDEYYNLDGAYYDDSMPEIYQFYLCNVSDYEKEQAQAYGLIFSYSDKLECDVLCVDHYGTSWDYVLTNCPLFDTWEELEAHNNKGE